jgi:hypothetical protein
MIRVPTPLIPVVRHKRQNPPRWSYNGVIARITGIDSPVR